MRILIDMQGAQTASQNRGIGRYSISIVDSIIQFSPLDWEINLLFNSAFDKETIFLRRKFSDRIAPDRMHYFRAVQWSAGMDQSGRARTTASEIIRETKIEFINPDVVLNTCIFEGAGDDAVITVSDHSPHRFTASVLYDIIPFLFQPLYLSDPRAKASYALSWAQIMRSDLLLCISEATREDAVTHWHYPGEQAVNISGAPDAAFGDLSNGGLSKTSLTALFGIENDYVLYTGGIDYRKNIDLLIRSFSQLEPSVLATHTLVIVCRVTAEERLQVLEAAGFDGDLTRIVFTGYISEEHLIGLYRHCSLFVFPSWYEGLGLPVLEAAACGAPVIAANESSFPEIIELQSALFDPYSVDDCRAHLERGLTDLDFRAELIANSLRIAEKFTWNRSAILAIDAINERYSSYCATRQVPPEKRFQFETRPYVALVSPYPPIKSGVAEFTAHIAPELAKYARLDLVGTHDSISSFRALSAGKQISLETFETQAWRYDFVIYQIGDSTFHKEIVELAKKYPGVAIVHDFSLSGLYGHLFHLDGSSLLWFSALRDGHGLSSAIKLYSDGPFKTRKIAKDFPVTFEILTTATSVVVHSAYALNLAKQFYGALPASKTSVLTLPRPSPQKADRQRARLRLGLQKDDFLLCTFGYVADEKYAEELLRAWGRSDASQHPRSKFYFVGSCPSDQLRLVIERMIERLDLLGRVRILGFVSTSEYETYLQAADAAVQLRRSARGETSAALMDCLNYGLPTIVNANGSFADVSTDIVIQISDKFTEKELSEAISMLYSNLDEFLPMARRGKDFVATFARPENYAMSLLKAISTANEGTAYWRTVSAKRIQKAVLRDWTDFDRKVTAQALSVTFPTATAKPRIYFDVGAIVNSEYPASDEMQALIKTIVCESMEADVHRLTDIFNISAPRFAYPSKALEYIFELKEFPSVQLESALHPSDIAIVFLTPHLVNVDLRSMLDFVTSGGQCVLFVNSQLLDLCRRDLAVTRRALQHLVALCTLCIATDSATAAELELLLNTSFWQKGDRLKITVASDCGSDVREIFHQIAQQGATYLDALRSRTWVSGLRRILSVTSEEVALSVGERFSQEVRTTGIAGHLIYGPYYKLEGGTYEFILYGSCVTPGGAQIEILSAGENIIACDDITASLNKHRGLARLKFHLEKDVHGLEVRIFVSSTTILRLSHYEIVRVPNSSDLKR